MSSSKSTFRMYPKHKQNNTTRTVSQQNKTKQDKNTHEEGEVDITYDWQARDLYYKSKTTKANWISPEASTFNPDVGEQHQSGDINVQHETWREYYNNTQQKLKQDNSNPRQERKTKQVLVKVFPANNAKQNNTDCQPTKTRLNYT